MPRIIWTAHLDQQQEQLWHTALTSQQLTVAPQPTCSNIVDKLNLVYGDERNYPDLILLDVGIKCPNSEMLQFGSICQWVMEKLHPPKIVLVNPRQGRVRNLEKSWALRRGATDLLPRLTAENYQELVASVTQILGRPCASDLLRSAMRGCWQESTNDMDTTGDLTAGFIQAPPLAQVTATIKNPPPEQSSVKYVTYRGVRIRK